MSAAGSWESTAIPIHRCYHMMNCASCETFNCVQEYVLGPGDILYVPPGVAHWGTAIGECTTFSIGFRAPRLNDMVSRWADKLLEQMDSELHYSDSHIEPATRAGEIRSRDLERVRAQLQAALDEEIGSQWFGELVTEPRDDCTHDDDDLAEARELLLSGSCFISLSRRCQGCLATGVRGCACICQR